MTICDHCLPEGDHYLDCILDARDEHTTHQTIDGRRFSIATIDGTPFTP